MNNSDVHDQGNYFELVNLSVRMEAVIYFFSLAAFQNFNTIKTVFITHTHLLIIIAVSHCQTVFHSQTHHATCGNISL